MPSSKKQDKKPKRDIETLLITSGRDKDEPSLPPVHYPAAVFENPSLDEAHRMSQDPDAFRLYTRYGNPTTNAFEAAVAELESAERSRAFASGMGAIATVLMGICETGDHIVAQSQLYAGTITLLKFLSERFGIEVSYVDGIAQGEFQRAVQKGKTKVIFAETPANPRLGIVDLEELGKIPGPIKIVDSTLAPPVIQTPLKYGIDIVIHSGTKFIGGHNDATLGVASGSDDLMRSLWVPAVSFGANASPGEALKGLKGIRTLGVRLERQCASALELAVRLGDHPQVESVSYPWLESHPQHELAKKQMRSGGALVCFDIKAPNVPKKLKERARQFFDEIKLVRLASSLGGPETLATHPASTTHVDLEPEELAAAGIGEGSIRVSLGLENIDDIASDILGALDRV